MQKRPLFLVLLLSAQMLMHAQAYYAIRNDGAVPAGYFLDKVYQTDKTILLNQPANNSLSGVYGLPFDFTFYGKTVNAYRASENGYVSFNTGTTDAVVPDTSLPWNSICVFGRDFKLQVLPEPNIGLGTQVFAYTVGKSPNRSHIIQYYGLTLAEDPLTQPVTNASIYAFAIVFHEGTDGRFDLIYSPFGNKNIKGAIGCASDSGQHKFLLDDSLKTLPFQFSFDPSKFIVYQFYTGLQPDYDLEIKDMELQSMYPINAIVNCRGKLGNRGKKRISAFYLNYSVNGKDTISYYVDNQDLGPSGLGTMQFVHPVSWLGGAAGSLNQLNFWLSEPDGFVDENPLNSHFTKTILRTLNKNDIDRNVLIEEGTGAWCGYCPDAHLLVSDAVKKHGRRVIPVAYHYDDSMSNADGDTFLSTYIRSYPDALLDRKVFLGSNSTWAAEIDSRVNAKVPVEVKIEQKSFDPLSREIRFRVRITFTDYWYGKLSIGSMLTEDDIRGNEFPNIWSQNNYYSKFNPGGAAGGESHRLYNELHFMHGYRHRHVHKASPGGVWGLYDTLPEFINPDESFFADFSYTLPEPAFVKYSAENNTPYCSTLDRPGENEGRNIPARISLIGYVAMQDEDPFKRPLINAVGVPLWDLTGLPELENGNKLLVFPNPAAAKITIRSGMALSGSAELRVYNTAFQLLQTIQIEDLSALANGFDIEAGSWPEGLYMLHLQKEGLSIQRQLLISR